MQGATIGQESGDRRNPDLNGRTENLGQQVQHLAENIRRIEGAVSRLGGNLRKDGVEGPNTQGPEGAANIKPADIVSRLSIELGTLSKLNERLMRCAGRLEELV